MDLISMMRVFVSVADKGSMASAGRDLNLSPSVMSKNLSALEDRLGARLLTRTTRSVSLTEVGHAYLDRARSCLLYTSPSPRDRTRSRMPSSA